MNKDIKIIFEKYIKILENDNISNNMTGSDASTKNQIDHTARFLPIGRDTDEEEKNKMLESEKIRIKLKDFFNSVKSLATICQKDSVTYKELSNFISIINDPAVKNDLDKLKMALQSENVEAGVNASLPS